MSIFQSVESLTGGALLTSVPGWVVGYSAPQRLLMPASGALMHVYQRGTTTPVSVFPNSDGSGSPLTQPLSADADGRVPGFVAQPAELDLAISGTGVVARTIQVGLARDPVTLTDVHTVGSDAAMLAISGAHEGTVAIRTDLSSAVFMHNGGTAGTDADWTEITFIGDPAGAAAAVLAISVQKAANLSDVADAGASRANLHVPALTPAAVAVTTNVASRSGLNTYDGYTCVDGDQVLLTGQTAASQNGPWVAHSGAWTRPTDFATGLATKARTIAILDGVVHGGETWRLQTNTSITVDTNVQSWVPHQAVSVVRMVSPPAAGQTLQFDGTNSDAVPVAMPTGGGSIPDGVAPTQVGTEIVPYLPVDTRVGLPAPDALWVANVDSEASMFTADGGLLGSQFQGFDPAHVADSGKIMPGGGPQGENALRLQATNGPNWPLDGTLHHDEFTLVIPFLPRGADLTALVTTAGAGDIPIFQVNSASLISQTLLAYFDAGGTAGATRLVVRLTRNESNMTAGGVGAQQAQIIINPVAVGKCPADVWSYLMVTLDATSGLRAQIGADALAVNGTAAVGFALRPWSNAASGGLNLGGITIGNASDKGVDFGKPRVHRWSQNKAAFSLVDSGYERTVSPPTVTLDQSTVARAFPPNLVGVVCQPQFAAQFANILANLKSAGCPWIRSAEISYWAPIAALNGLGNAPTINFASVQTGGGAWPETLTWDQAFSQYASAGIPIAIDIGYTPVGLQEGGDNQKPPFDPGGSSMSAIAVDAFARWASACVNRLLNVNGVTLADLTSYNEPGEFTPTQLAALWLATAQRLHTDFPSLPSLGINNGIGYELADNRVVSEAQYSQALLTSAHANGFTPAAYLHRYDLSLTEFAAYLDAATAYLATLTPIPQLRVTEMAPDKGWSANEMNGGYLPGAHDKRTAGPYGAAWAHAMIYLALNKGVDMTAWFCTTANEGQTQGLNTFLFDDTGRPTTLFYALSLMWKHAGNQLATTSNLDHVRTIATRTVSTTTITFSNVKRVGNPDGGTTQRFDFVPSHLASTFTWKMWKIGKSTAGIGQLPLVAQGNQTNLPSKIEIDNGGLVGLQIVG